MSVEDDDNSNLPELTPISSNQHVKKVVQTLPSQQLIALSMKA